MIIGNRNRKITKTTSSIIDSADDFLEKMNSTPYQIYLDKFHWGSNSIIACIATNLCYAHMITGEQKYLYAVISNIDYIFGKNAVGYSFVTGLGTKPPMFIHHRTSGADSIEAPIPGLLAGGPNVEQQDKEYLTYSSKLPAKSYMDVEASYASNENCINWNAPLVFILGYLEMNAN